MNFDVENGYYYDLQQKQNEGKYNCNYYCNYLPEKESYESYESFESYSDISTNNFSTGWELVYGVNAISYLF